MNPRQLMACLLASAAIMLTAGCGGSDTASLMVDGSDTALTLERIRPYAWSDQWELELVVRRVPDCQRRHKLKPAGMDSFRMDLFTPAPGVFIVKQGKRWYVTDLRSCDLQAFKTAPPEPGKPVGSFREQDDVLRFVKIED